MEYLSRVYVLKGNEYTSMLSSITRREIVIGSVIQNMDKSGFDHES